MTSQYLPVPVFRAFDSAGDPLAGGTVSVYNAGGSTLQTVYGLDGTTPITNPVTLDTTGSAVIRLDPSIGYKLELKDSGGASQWVIDNFQPYPLSSTDSVFAATRTSSAQTLSVSSVQTLVFNHEDADPESTFDTSTGIFTANVAGTFLFTCAVTVQNQAVNSGVLNRIYLSKNSGAATINIGYGQAGQTLAGASNATTWAGVGTFVLAQNDTVKVVADVGAGFGGGGSFTFNIGSAFSGKKIG